MTHKYDDGEFEDILWKFQSIKKYDPDYAKLIHPNNNNYTLICVTSFDHNNY